MKKDKIQKAFKFAFPKTLPIFAGFWFLGMSYGILMHVKGFSFVYPLLMSMTIFGGSLEFIAVSMLLSTFAPLRTFLVALVYAAIALVPMLCMYSKRELTFRQYILREVFRLLAIEAVLIIFGFGTESLLPENRKLTSAFAFSVFVIYIFVVIISWLLDLKQAKTINSNLKSFQSRFSDKTN